MQETSTSPGPILQFRQHIAALFRRHIREALEMSLAEELAIALGSDRHERTDDRKRAAELLTFYDFPPITWKSIRTTNILEDINCVNRSAVGYAKTAISTRLGTDPL